jgi:NAD(P)-dependent dehydrogenase (short-subunit alcohol dehydrogenase family)
MSRLNGLTAVVTGGASGIGAATVTALRATGARVGVLDLTSGSYDDDLLSVTCDITDSSAVTAAVQRVAETFGGLDIVVNNAGVGATGDVAANDDAEWHRVFDVNVVGIARVSRVALPYLRRSSAPAIVNTCSVVAMVGLAQRALYSASKGAVAALTYAMAADLVRDGIRVNAVVPGTADTPWVARLLAEAASPDEMARALTARQPMGRLVSADEVADAILYLCAASSTTGTLLPVDGGLTGIRAQ